MGLIQGAVDRDVVRVGAAFDDDAGLAIEDRLDSADGVHPAARAVDVAYADGQPFDGRGEFAKSHPQPASKIGSLGGR